MSRVNEEKGPEEMWFVPSRTKGALSFLVLFPLFVLCAIGAVYGFVVEKSVSGGAIGIGFSLFFGGIAVMGLGILLRWRSYLVLRTDGFEECFLGRKREYKWKEVSEFAAFSVMYGPFKIRSYVTFDQPDDQSRIGKLNRVSTGSSAALKNTYTVDAETLADTMTVYRGRVLREGGSLDQREKPAESRQGSKPRA